MDAHAATHAPPYSTPTTTAPVASVMPIAPAPVPATMVDFRHNRVRRIQLVQDTIAGVDDGGLRFLGADNRSDSRCARQSQQACQK